MHKKLFAAASLALASGALLAQSNVQIYGSIDVGFSHRGDNIQKGVKSQNSIDSGLSAGNRLGFSGTEDLGGFKALFQLEAGFLADTGSEEYAQGYGGGRLFARQAFAGLTGNFGTVIAGRLYTPHYSFISTVDPFKGGTVGHYNNAYGSDLWLYVAGLNGAATTAPAVSLTSHNASVVGTVLDPVRVDNAVAYVSPAFSGANVTLAYANNAIAQESAGGGRQQNRVFAILPRYTNGPLDIGLNFHVIKASKDLRLLGASDALAGELPLVDVDTVTNWLLGGTYDLGSVKLAGYYSATKVKLENLTPLVDISDLKVKSWLLGATIPFGKHAAQFSYSQSQARLRNDTAILPFRLNDKSRQWAVGYTYNLSRRTNLYAVYSDIRNDDNRHASVGDAANAWYTEYQNGFQFGVKHTF
jgi:predicted porin